MIRRFAVVPLRQSTAVVAPVARRNVCDCALMVILSNVGCHALGFVQPSAYALSSLAYSPVATTASVALAYNGCIGGLVYAWLYLEMVTRDYVQDLVYATLLRYMFYIALLLTCENLFVEA